MECIARKSLLKYTDSPLSSDSVKLEKQQLRNMRFPQLFRCLAGLKPAKQRDIPEDQYPERRH